MGPPNGTRLSLPKGSKSSPTVQSNGFQTNSAKTKPLMEEVDELVDLGYDDSNRTVPRSPSESMSPRIGSSTEAQSEMDLRSGSSDFEEETDGSDAEDDDSGSDSWMESEDDDDDEEDSSSSAWDVSGDEENSDDVDHFALLHLNRESVPLMMTPFDAVVKRAEKDKNKKAEVVMYPPALHFQSDDLLRSEENHIIKLQHVQMVCLFIYLCALTARCMLIGQGGLDQIG